MLCRIISQPITFVNTSLHGVSDVFVKHAFEILGFPLFVPVFDQQHPHPDFPTVSFPNPEEKGQIFSNYKYSNVNIFIGALVSALYLEIESFLINF